MIVLKTKFGERVELDRGVFRVPDSTALETLLNTLARIYPALGMPPDADATLLDNVRPYAPGMDLVSNDFVPDPVDPEEGVTKPFKIY